MASPENNSSNKEFKNISKNLIETVQNLEQLQKNATKVSYNPKDGYILVDQGQGKRIKKINPLDLRIKCICAGCVDEMTGQSFIKTKNINENVYPTKIEEKGNYAVAMIWSDGHRSSIYPYKRLLSNDIPQIDSVGEANIEQSNF